MEGWYACHTSPHQAVTISCRDTHRQSTNYKVMFLAVNNPYNNVALGVSCNSFKGKASVVYHKNKPLYKWLQDQNWFSLGNAIATISILLLVIMVCNVSHKKSYEIQRHICFLLEEGES